MIYTILVDDKIVADDEINHGFDDLRQSCEGAVTRLKSAHGWSDADVRVECIHRLRNISQSILATRVFHRAIFPTESFWQAFFQSSPKPAEFADHFRELDMLLRFSAIQGFFSAVESDVRAIVFAIDPTACGGASATFDGLIRWLLGRATTVTGFGNFVELLRLTRNTIHNNGVHRPPSAGNKSIPFGDQDYDFNYGKPIEFADWKYVLVVGKNILAILEKLADDPIVAAVPQIRAF